jgi:hypothetical protein
MNIITNNQRERKANCGRMGQSECAYSMGSSLLFVPKMMKQKSTLGWSSSSNQEA